jgi:ankyrin repeat protein
MQALRARFQPSSPVAFREGFLNKHEFFILLARFQAGLGVDDQGFKQKYVDRVEGASWASKKEAVQKNSADDYHSYTDGHTEYTQLYSPGLSHVEARPTTQSGAEGELVPHTESMKPPQPSSYWVCSTCSLHNFGGPPCDACGSEYPAGQYSNLTMNSGGESSRLRPVSVHQQDSFKEVFMGSEGIEVVPHQDSFKELSMVPEGKEVNSSSTTTLGATSLKSPVGSTSKVNMPNLMPRLSVRKASHPPGPSIATKESDAEALSIMKALEPKNSTFSMKRLGRKILPQDAEKLDKAHSGYSFTILAEALVSAAEAGNLLLVASLLKLGADVNYSSRKTKKLHNAIQRATKAQHVHVVEYFLTRGANEESAANALNVAIRRNFMEIAMKLVPHADFNRMWITSTKWKPFDDESFYAIPESFLDSSVQESCLSLLVGMKEENRNKLLTLIMDQPRFDSEKPAKEIYVKPWNFGALRYPMTILDCFVESADLAGVEFLLQQLGKGYKVHSKTPEWLSGPKPIYRNPLSYISIESWGAKPAHALKVAELLTKRGAHVDVTSLLPNDQKKEGDSPLISAIAGRSVKGVEFFLANGADPECIMATNGHSFWGLSPLSYAASYCGVGICRTIVDHGALPWRSDESGKNPLYYACSRGNLEAVEYFLSVDVARSDINLCLEAAIEANEPRVVKALTDVGALATADVWEYAMSVKRIGKERFPYFQIIDLLLLTESRLHTDLVLTAIDKDNLAGLSRVLEKRNGKLDFDRDEIFADKRWFNVSRTVPFHSTDTGSTNPSTFLRRDWQNCLAYAEEKGAEDFISLLKSYSWVSNSKCLCDDAEYARHNKQLEDKSSGQPPPYRS